MAIIETDYESVRRSLRWRKRGQFQAALTARLQASDANKLDLLRRWAALSDRVYNSLLSQEVQELYEQSEKSENRQIEDEDD